MCAAPPAAAAAAAACKHILAFFFIITSHYKNTTRQSQLHVSLPLPLSQWHRGLVGSCALTSHHTALPPLSVTASATSPKLSHKQAITLRFILTSLLQSERRSRVSRGERARSPHFLDRDAPLGAALGGRAPADGEPGGLGLLPTVVSDRTAMPHSADRHNKTTSRPTQDTLRRSAPPRTAGPVGTAPRPLSLRQWAGATSPPY